MTLILNWHKMDGLLPAVIQDAGNGAVLMLGYMNSQALSVTQASGRVTFWSRSRQRLWTKGETSGHFLQVREIAADCDGDTLLVLADPVGPACHAGTPTCWGAAAPQSDAQPLAFLGKLEAVVTRRLDERPAGSYTTHLVGQGIRRVAQKVGEEGVELALAAVAQGDQEILNEAADLVFHTILLLRAKGLSLAQVTQLLESRHAAPD